MNSTKKTSRINSSKKPKHKQTRKRIRFNKLDKLMIKTNNTPGMLKPIILL